MKAKHSVGAICWGREETSSYLFASSEPRNRQDNTGFHRAYDICSQKFAYTFSAQEAGDAMALEQSGECQPSSPSAIPTTHFHDMITRSKIGFVYSRLFRIASTTSL